MSEINIAELFENNEQLAPLTELIHSITDLPDDQLNEENVQSIINGVEVALSPKLKQLSIDSLLNSFAEQNLTIDGAIQLIAEVKTSTRQ